MRWCRVMSIFSKTLARLENCARVVNVSDAGPMSLLLGKKRMSRFSSDSSIFRGKNTKEPICWYRRSHVWASLEKNKTENTSSLLSPFWSLWPILTELSLERFVQTLNNYILTSHPVISFHKEGDHISIYNDKVNIVAFFLFYTYSTPFFALSALDY